MFLAGHLITRQHFEIKLHEAEINFSKQLVERLTSYRKLLEEHEALASKINDIRKSGTVVNAAQLNELWREVQNKLSNSAAHKT